MVKKIQTTMVDLWFKLLICLVVVIINAQAGQVQNIGGLNSYVSGPADSHTAVIMASDVFGYEVPHLRQIADKVGAAGIYTLIPDFFHGDPFISNDPKKPFQDWIIKHPAAKGIEDATRVVEALKSESINKIGAAGFCWGGKVAVDLAKTPYIQALVLSHPTFTTVDDIRGIKLAPTAIFGGANDTQSPPDLLLSFHVALDINKVENIEQIFPGVQHAFTTIYNDTDPAEVKIANLAHQKLVDWFVKYLN